MNATTEPEDEIVQDATPSTPPIGSAATRFEILGPMRVFSGAREAVVAGAKRRSVLIGLLANANRPVSIDTLIDWLWPDNPPPTAALAVQTHVSVLRRTIEPARRPGGPVRILFTHGRGYLLRATAGSLDTLRFAELLAAGSTALRAGDAERAATLLREALGLWRGDALSDVRDVEAAAAEIARLEELRLAARTLCIDADLRQGHCVDVVPELVELVAQHPLHERFYAQLMVALADCGRRAEALATYRRARTILHEQLAVEPGPELRRLESAILSGDPASLSDPA